MARFNADSMVIWASLDDAQAEVERVRREAGVMWCGTEGQEGPHWMEAPLSAGTSFSAAVQWPDGTRFRLSNGTWV